MIYFFVQHKVHHIPGGTFSGGTQPQREHMLTSRHLAYTRYAFFEWSLILFDILYDSLATLDLEESGIEASIIYQSPHSCILTCALHVGLLQHDDMLYREARWDRPK